MYRKKLKILPVSQKLHKRINISEHIEIERLTELTRKFTILRLEGDRFEQFIMMNILLDFITVFSIHTEYFIGSAKL